jgi:hypothetical protein
MITHAIHCKDLLQFFCLIEARLFNKQTTTSDMAVGTTLMSYAGVKKRISPS